MKPVLLWPQRSELSHYVSHLDKLAYEPGLLRALHQHQLYKHQHKVYLDPDG